jgi:hypothetical protein
MVTYLAGNRIRGTSTERGTFGLSSGLKAYWKFNEASGDIINQAGTVGSTDSLGSGADLQVTGATYDVTGKIGKALSFDGTNDYALAGSSLSQWNYAHSTTATSTIVAWILSDVDQTEKVIFDDSIALQGGGTTVQSGVTFETRSVNKLGYTVRNTSGQTITQLITTANIYPDNTNYFMACVTYDHNLSSDNLKISVNDGTRQTATKSANTPTNGNANGVGTVASRSRLNTGFLNGNICEMSIWNRVLTDAEITALYNSGTGKTIDTVKGATWTRGFFNSTDTTLFSTSTGWTGDTTVFTNSGDTMVWDTSVLGQAVVKTITTLPTSGEWVMRFKVTRVSGDLNDGSFLTLGSSSASTSTLARMQNGNGLYPYGIHVAYFANGNKVYIGGSHNTSFAWDSSSTTSVDWSVGDSKWIEVSHASATAFTTKIYSNANFTGTADLTNVASTSGQTLDYDEFAIGTKWTANRKNMIIEDMQIWNGVTSPP